MESALLAVALLACPVGMGAMMWFMARSRSKDATAAGPSAPQSPEQLRAEHARLSREIDKLHADRQATTSGGGRA